MCKEECLRSEQESTVASDVRFVGYVVSQNGIHVLAEAERAAAVAVKYLDGARVRPSLVRQIAADLLTCRILRAGTCTCTSTATTVQYVDILVTVHSRLLRQQMKANARHCWYGFEIINRNFSLGLISKLV